MTSANRYVFTRCTFDEATVSASAFRPVGSHGATLTVAKGGTSCENVFETPDDMRYRFDRPRPADRVATAKAEVR